jgi:hypothetical protein
LYLIALTQKDLFEVRDNSFAIETPRSIKARIHMAFDSPFASMSVLFVETFVSL